MWKIIIFFVLFFYLMPTGVYGRYSEERNIQEINRLLREQDAELGNIRKRLEQCSEYLNGLDKLKESEISEEDRQMITNAINNLKLHNNIIGKIIDECRRKLSGFKKIE